MYYRTMFYICAALLVVLGLASLIGIPVTTNYVVVVTHEETGFGHAYDTVYQPIFTIRNGKQFVINGGGGMVVDADVSYTEDLDNEWLLAYPNVETLENVHCITDLQKSTTWLPLAHWIKFKQANAQYKHELQNGYPTMACPTEG